MPDAVVAIYPALQVQFSLSPSRLLSVMDPLLPEVSVEWCMTADSIILSHTLSLTAVISVLAARHSFTESHPLSTDNSH